MPRANTRVERNVLDNEPAKESPRLECHKPSIAELTQYAEQLERRVRKEVPLFDPRDGGTSAEVLFLFETPGRRANNSGFISRDNPDPTAKCFFELNRKVGLNREWTVSWNVVPWYIGTPTKISRPNPEECEQAAKHLEGLLILLKELRAVVFFGRIAALHGPIPVANAKPGLRLFAAPHPSQRSLNSNNARKNKIFEVLCEVKELVNSRGRC